MKTSLTILPIFALFIAGNTITVSLSTNIENKTGKPIMYNWGDFGMLTKITTVQPGKESNIPHSSEELRVSIVTGQHDGSKNFHKKHFITIPAPPSTGITNVSNIALSLDEAGNIVATYAGLDPSSKRPTVATYSTKCIAGWNFRML